MDIDALFESVIGSFCGVCCSRESACETCLGHTLKANGFADVEENRARIRGKSKQLQSQVDPWEFSDMAKELGVMLKEVRDDTEEGPQVLS